MRPLAAFSRIRGTFFSSLKRFQLDLQMLPRFGNHVIHFLLHIDNIWYYLFSFLVIFGVTSEKEIVLMVLH